MSTQGQAVSAVRFGIETIDPDLEDGPLRDAVMAAYDSWVPQLSGEAWDPAGIERVRARCESCGQKAASVWEVPAGLLYIAVIRKGPPAWVWDYRPSKGGQRLRGNGLLVRDLLDHPASVHPPLRAGCERHGEHEQPVSRRRLAFAVARSRAENHRIPVSVAPTGRPASSVLPYRRSHIPPG